MHKFEPTFFNIREGYNHIRIHYSEVFFIETVDRKLYLYTKDKKYIIAGTIGSMFDNLNQKCEYFFCCHRAYIVNLHKIIKIDKEIIYLENGVDVPLSRLKRSGLKERLKEVWET